MSFRGHRLYRPNYPPPPHPSPSAVQRPGLEPELLLPLHILVHLRPQRRHRLVLGLGVGGSQGGRLHVVTVAGDESACRTGPGPTLWGRTADPQRPALIRALHFFSTSSSALFSSSSLSAPMSRSAQKSLKFRYSASAAAVAAIWRMGSPQI